MTPRRTPLSVRLPAVAVALGVLVAAGCGQTHRETGGDTPAPATTLPVLVEARTPGLPTYPCTQCHADRPVNATERPLKEFHTRVDLVHGTVGGWCYRCHTKDNFDKLHLFDGTLVSFDEAYTLCGSCHGDKMRDWKDGIHGLTTGNWNGQRYKRSCTACHNPHKPKFGAMVPERPPARPSPHVEVRPEQQGEP